MGRLKPSTDLAMRNCPQHILSTVQRCVCQPKKTSTTRSTHEEVPHTWLHVILGIVYLFLTVLGVSLQVMQISTSKNMPPVTTLILSPFLVAVGVLSFCLKAQRRQPQGQRRLALALVILSGITALFAFIASVFWIIEFTLKKQPSSRGNDPSDSRGTIIATPEGGTFEQDDRGTFFAICQAVLCCVLAILLLVHSVWLCRGGFCCCSTHSQPVSDERNPASVSYTPVATGTSQDAGTQMEMKEVSSNPTVVSLHLDVHLHPSLPVSGDTLAS